MRPWRLAPLALLASGAVYAAHPLVTDDTGTQGAGRWQLEVNAEWTRDEGVKAVSPAATLAYGFAENADVQFTVPYLSIRNGEEGVLDTALEVKWRFHERGPLSFALLPGVFFPTGDETQGFGAGRTRWGTLAIASYEPEGPFAFHAHAGYTRNRNKLGERESIWQLAGALWWQAAEKLNLIVDLSTDTNPGGGRDLRRVVLGAIYAVNKDLDLDVGLRWGNAPAIDRAFLAGVTLRW